MHPVTQAQLNLTRRRQFFGQQGVRLGSLALAAMAGQSLAANDKAQPPAAAPQVHPPLPVCHTLRRAPNRSSMCITTVAHPNMTRGTTSHN